MEKQASYLVYWPFGRNTYTQLERIGWILGTVVADSYEQAAEICGGRFIENVGGMGKLYSLPIKGVELPLGQYLGNGRSELRCGNLVFQMRLRCPPNEPFPDKPIFCLRELPLIQRGK